MVEHAKYGNQLEIEFQKLNKTNCYILSNFTCYKINIQKYFREEAVADNHYKTHLFVDVTAEPEIITAMTICCSAINLSSRDMFSAIEISNFATNEKYQKISYSEDWDDGTLSHNILLYCINYIKEFICSICAADAIVLYSVPDAVNFYRKAGFLDFEEYMVKKDNPYLEGCIPMYFPLTEINRKTD